MPLSAIAFWLVYCGGVATATIVPLVGVLLYVLVYHINPEYQWWGESVRSLGLRTSMTIVLAIAVGLLLRRPRFGGVGRQFSLPIAGAIGLALLAVASLTWGYGLSERGAFQAEKLLKVMIFVLILIRCVRQPRDYQLVIIAWLCGIFYIGYEAFGNVGVHRDGRLSTGLGGPDFAESSDLAVHLVASLPLIGAMFFMARRWWSRGVILLTGALAVNTLIMTRTRNAIFGLAAIVIAAALSLPKGYRLKGWAAMIAGMLLALQLTDPGWWGRMRTTIDYAQDASASDRIRFWEAALAMSADHPFGIGLGNFHEVVQEYVPGISIARSAHNSYLECLAEIGVPGLLMLLLILIVTLRRLTRIRRLDDACAGELIDIGYWQARFHIGWHAMALRTALIGYLACAVFTTRLWAEDFWILIGLAACLANVHAYARCQSEVAVPEAQIASSGAIAACRDAEHAGAQAESWGARA